MIVGDFADTNHVAGMVIKELPASIRKRVRYMESFSADITHLFTILRTMNAKDSASKIPPTTILELGPGKRTRAWKRLVCILFMSIETCRNVDTYIVYVHCSIN